MSASVLMLSLMGGMSGVYLAAWYFGRKAAAKLKASWEKPTVPAPTAPEQPVVAPASPEPPAGTEAK